MKLLTTICTAWFLVAGPAILGAQTTAQAEKLLESARHKEVMDGDLKAAIEQYRKIAAQFSKQPEIAARALYQLGQCQEKLGQAEARKSYERIVREYGGVHPSTPRRRATAGGDGRARPRRATRGSESGCSGTGRLAGTGPRPRTEGGCRFRTGEPPVWGFATLFWARLAW